MPIGMAWSHIGMELRAPVSPAKQNQAIGGSEAAMTGWMNRMAWTSKLQRSPTIVTSVAQAPTKATSGPRADSRRLISLTRRMISKSEMTKGRGMPGIMRQ
ncbi:hypothetical protein [Mesorhizobium sp.]|uniref:hypothetical protein n=1 Tax=Mesorhizobium sp. TaxID=1871066 RepID=UPI0025C01CFE|nr:hypothetical protein [Mesorhizobium sp.]